MRNLPNGTIIGFSARFNCLELACWKHLFTKPFHYVIQIMTGSKLHHVGIMCKGDPIDYYAGRIPDYWEAMGKTGVRCLKLSDKIKETDSIVDLYIFEPMEEFSEEKRVALEDDLNSQLGKKYNVIQAIYSAIDRLIFFNLFKTKKKTKTMFCSKLIFIAYQKLYKSMLNNIIPRTLNPEEGIKTLRKKRLIRSGYILQKKLYI